MLVARMKFVAALLALAAFVDSSLASAVPDADELSSSSSSSSTASVAAAATASASLFSALDVLNATVGGRLKKAVPFEAPCFSILEGKHVAVDTAACAAIQSNYTDPTFRVTHFGAYMLPQWETCQSSSTSEGCLLDNSNPTNPLAIDGVNCQLGNVPPYYIEVKSVTDVQAALAFSRLTGVRLSVKNKGHDYKGRSSGKDTLNLWVTNLRSMSHSASFRPEGCVGKTYDAITTGAGVFTQDVYEFADSVNRTIIAGYHQTIGFSGGYFLGGGHSVLSPVYGLAADRVVQVKVVTPDGVYRTANECQNKDLFFALRGGGGSAFGVVIESTHLVEPLFPIQAAVLRFAPSASTDLAAWYSLMVENSYQWANDGWGGHIVGPSLIHVTPLLSNEEAKASMQPAVDFVTAHNGTVTIEQLPSYLAFFTKYVTAAQAAVGPELELGTRLLPSKFFSTPEGRTQLTALINDTLSFASPYIVAGTPWLFNTSASPGGASAVTPAWRDAIWHLSVKWQFSFDDTLAERKEGYSTLEEHIQRFRDLTPGSGAYFNEGDVYEPDHETSYWGDNYPKLLAVKRKYDPHGLLDCWQCVGWKGESDDLYQCHIKL
ncbi:FAD-binding domain-containing protein [Lentinus tigrinus ALCF2SS1-7]|uniref:FAD-binding domain-containing protein n=1 Tax=Lentinus tigrinus ALCF2SS1-6 TaxID=1328759 RepID=A0A5C2RX77_9APHY|nr:FAD-binding domain-containing protein [Lentinus tigrinus ALCF2SS1-6]RPD72498.1 FAD-binding domain-containing protein [Lentinus tigrinus ALCF2SS1-7]